MDVVTEHVAILAAIFGGIGAILTIVLRRDSPSDQRKRQPPDPPE
jgi:uncharacterized membrane protein